MMTVGLKVIRVPGDPSTTLDRLSAAVTAMGMLIFGRIDFAEDAGNAGLSIPATSLLLFGNPRLGTVLVKENRQVAIDLPLKAIAWTDDDGNWLAYNDPAYLASRHNINSTDVISKMSSAIESAVDQAVRNSPKPSEGNDR